MLFLFDLDDTLIEGYLKEGEKVHPFDRVVVFPTVLPWLRQVTGEHKQQAPHFALITNQAGVAFGYETVEAVETKIGKVCAALNFFYGCPFSVHICYTHPKATLQQYKLDDPRRKPHPGMLHEAMGAHRRHPQQSIYVGDLPTDAEAAEAAGVRHVHPSAFFSPVAPAWG